MAEEFLREIIRTHFSHPHPLKLIVYKQTLNITFPCSGCKLKPSGVLYTCSNCDYFLHQNCFEMPKKMTHPSHKKHALTLMPKPAYTNHRFVCDACGERGNGFSYHCDPCGIDLHMLCAIMPSSLAHSSHTMHKLKLAFESPYPQKKFSCDICMNMGSRQWLYRCESCRFDAHVKCAAGGDAPLVRTKSLSKESTKAREVATSSKLAPSAPELPQNVMPDPPFQLNRSQNNEVAVEAVRQMIIHNSTALAEAILSGIVSGENRGLHLLIEWISALKNNGINIRGGGFSELDAFASSGEGGQLDSVQVVTNCGGGAGGDAADSVQAVTDGGGGRSSAVQDYFKAVMGGGGGGGGGSLPEKITHRFDKKHALTLLTKPAYAEGRFKCDACGERGKGFSYICQPCGIDLHVSCTMMPFLVTHDSHVHTLRLTFVSPYPDKKFTCGVCLGPGSRHWLYRCDSCGFDAHMKCAGGDILPAHPTLSQPREAEAWGRPPPPPMMNSGFPEGQLPVNVPPFSVERQNNELTIQQLNMNSIRANTAMAQGLMRFISNNVNGGGEQQDYQVPIFGDGNGIGFLGDLFGG